MDSLFVQRLVGELSACAHRIHLRLLAGEYRELVDFPRYFLPPDSEIPPCPTCGDVAATQTVVRGMPAMPPTVFEADRVKFEGCMVLIEVDEDGDPIDDESLSADWFCPACTRYFS